VAKSINFHSYGTPRDQSGGSSNPFCGSPEAVYHKSVLHNHDMQYAMFKHKQKLTVKDRNFRINISLFHRVVFGVQGSIPPDITNP